MSETFIDFSIHLFYALTTILLTEVHLQGPQKPVIVTSNQTRLSLCLLKTVKVLRLCLDVQEEEGMSFLGSPLFSSTAPRNLIHLKISVFKIHRTLGFGFIINKTLKSKSQLLSLFICMSLINNYHYPLKKQYNNANAM